MNTLYMVWPKYLSIIEELFCSHSELQFVSLILMDGYGVVLAIKAKTFYIHCVHEHCQSQKYNQSIKISSS